MFFRAFIIITLTILFGVVATFVFLSVQSFYELNISLIPDQNFNNERLRINREAFALLGDFIGGIFNPFLTFISIALLVATLIITRKQLDETVAARELAELEAKELRKTHDQERKESSFYNLLPHYLDSVDAFQTANGKEKARDKYLFKILIQDDHDNELMIRGVLCGYDNDSDGGSRKFNVLVRNITSLIIISGDDLNLDYIAFSRLSFYTTFLLAAFSVFLNTEEAIIIRNRFRREGFWLNEFIKSRKNQTSATLLYVINQLLK